MEKLTRSVIARSAATWQSLKIAAVSFGNLATLRDLKAVAGPAPIDPQRCPGRTLSRRILRMDTIGAGLVLTVSFWLLGCAGPLKQQARTVRVAPVSQQHKLNETLQGVAYVLLAEASTGQEQHRYAVSDSSDKSDSLVRALKEYSPRSCLPPGRRGGGDLLLLPLKDKPARDSPFDENLEVFSFTDLTNSLNEKGASEKHAEMRDFYQKNGMFRKSDLQFLGKVIGADYFILPCLSDVRRWGTSRFSIFGLKVINTQLIGVVVSMEIWDTKTGYKVFSATSDVTIATERISESPISIDEAFRSAWFGIIEQLPYPSSTIQQRK